MSVPDLRTARLVLTPLSAEGTEACMAMDADPRVRRYFDPIADWGAYRNRLRRLLAGPYEPGQGFWSIADQRTPDRFLGWVMLIPLAGEGPQVEVGYRLRFEAWGRGIATEAAGVIRDHGFSTCKLDEIIAVTHPENTGSQRVLKKIGLTDAGTVDAYDRTLPLYRLGREDWSRYYGDKAMSGAIAEQRVAGLN